MRNRASRGAGRMIFLHQPHHVNPVFISPQRTLPRPCMTSRIFLCRNRRQSCTRRRIISGKLTVANVPALCCGSMSRFTWRQEQNSNRKLKNRIFLPGRPDAFKSSMATVPTVTRRRVRHRGPPWRTLREGVPVKLTSICSAMMRKGEGGAAYSTPPGPPALHPHSQEPSPAQLTIISLTPP